MTIAPESLAALADQIAQADALPAREARRRAQQTVFQVREAGFSPQEKQWLKDNCPFGYPVAVSGWDHGPTHYVIREGYALEHSDVDKIPLWVCEGVKKSQLTGPGDRDHSSFKADSKLPEGKRAELEDYRGSGYDRGHQAPAADHKVNQTRMDETFFLSNMAPQTGGLNRYIWAALEDQVRDWASERNFAYVITGPIFYDPEEENPATADGIIYYSTVGQGEVAVPTHFYKIVVAKNGTGEWEAIGFVLEHRSYSSPYDFAEHVHSIDWIEERTGLDFMPDLDAVAERDLEQNPSPIW